MSPVYSNHAIGGPTVIEHEAEVAKIVWIYWKRRRLPKADTERKTVKEYIL